MFSQLAKRLARVLPADLCTSHALYVKSHSSTVLKRKKKWRTKVGLFIIFWQFAVFDFMSLFRHIASGFRFSVKQFSSAEFGICCAYFTRTAEELSYRLVFCCKP